MGRHKILVVGGGIAGLSFATAAGQKGCDVEVAELDPRVEGMGIFLTGSTLRALDAIGTAGACVKNGWPAETLQLFDGAGAFVGESPLPRVASADLPVSAGIRRRSLARILDAAAEDAGARVRTGLTVDAISQDDMGCEVRFSDGTTGVYDVIVGADGIYSRVRELVFGSNLTPRHMGQGGWRFMTPRHPDVQGLVLYAAGGLKVGLVPLDDEWMYLFCTMADPNRERIRAAEAPERLFRLLQAFTAPLVVEMRERLRTIDPGAVLWRPFEALLVEEPWNRGRIVLIGDAAHSITPHLSSGGGLAIEDAMVLADHLARHVPVSQALAEFYDDRINRVRTVYDISLQICREEICNAPSAQRIYDLTAQGYGALGASFSGESATAKAGEFMIL